MEADSGEGTPAAHAATSSPGMGRGGVGRGRGGGASSRRQVQNGQPRPHLLKWDAENLSEL